MSKKCSKTRIFTDDSRVGRNDLRYIIHHQNEPTKQKLWQGLLDGRTDGQTILDIAQLKLRITKSVSVGFHKVFLKHVNNIT